MIRKMSRKETRSWRRKSGIIFGRGSGSFSGADERVGDEIRYRCPQQWSGCVAERRICSDALRWHKLPLSCTSMRNGQCYGTLNKNARCNTSVEKYATFATPRLMDINEERHIDDKSVLLLGQAENNIDLGFPVARNVKLNETHVINIVQQSIPATSYLMPPRYHPIQ